MKLNRCPPYTEIFSKRRKIYSDCVESLRIVKNKNVPVARLDCAWRVLSRLAFRVSCSSIQPWVWCSTHLHCVTPLSPRLAEFRPSICRCLSQQCDVQNLQKEPARRLTRHPGSSLNLPSPATMRFQEISNSIFPIKSQTLQLKIDLTQGGARTSKSIPESQITCFSITGDNTFLFTSDHTTLW